MAQQPSLSFEHPLNERMRTFLRTESLFHLAKFRYRYLSSEWDSRDCVTALIELFNLIERTEFRSELIKEIERHLAIFHRMVLTPAVDHRALEKVLKELEQHVNNVRQHTSRQGLFPKGSGLLNTIRQRLSIVGGTCSFDIPEFHYWLHLPERNRQHFLDQWIEALEPLEKALTFLLSLVRQSSVTTKEIAVSGYLQKSLSADSVPQLVRIAIRTEYNVYPEISANKHRVNVRLMQALFETEKNTVATQDIPLEFSCCAI